MTAWVPCRLEVGQQHGAQPKHIVGAITNETGLDGRAIGRIEICDIYSVVDLPDGMPKPIFQHLQNVKILGRPLRISLLRERQRYAGDRDWKKGKPGKPTRRKLKKAKSRRS